MNCETCGAKLTDGLTLCEACGADNGIENIGNYYRVDINRTSLPAKPVKNQRFTPFQLKIIVTACLVMIFGSSGGLYAANKILNPELFIILVEPSLDYDTVEPCGEELFRVRKNNKFGLINKTGQIVAPLIYHSIGDFSEGLAFAMKERNGETGYIDAKGSVVIDFIYDTPYMHTFNTPYSNFTDGLALVCYDNKFGAINKNGEFIIPAVYNYISYDYISSDYIIAMRNNEWGILDKSGEVVIPFENSSYAYYLGEDLFTVRINEKPTVINKSGDFIFELEENGYIGFFSEGLAVTAKYVISETGIESKYGYVNKAGEIVIPMIYEHAEAFDGGLAKAAIADGFDERGNPAIKYGYIDKTGEAVVPFEYNWITWEFIDGLVPVSNEQGKYGFVNKQGEIIIPLIYSFAVPFENGLAKVADAERKWGMIDKSNNMILPQIYDLLYMINDKLIIAQYDGKAGIINKKGETLLPFEYTFDTQAFKDNYICFKKDGKWGIIKIK